VIFNNYISIEFVAPTMLLINRWYAWLQLAVAFS